MRAATASAREPRGERTLMGIGPEFIRREIIADGVSGTLDGVPLERMDRTPSSPIVVEPQAVSPAPTVRIPLTSAARTVQLSRGPAPTVELPVDGTFPGARPPAGAPSRRLDSLVSARFFQEGEEQEANGWEDSPLVNEPFPDDEPPKFSSFDRVPRRRGPLIVTTFLLGTALVVGLAMEGGSGPARAWLAAKAGPRAVGIWNQVKTDLDSGFSIRLTPESTAASSRAMVSPSAGAEPTSAAPAASNAPGSASSAAIVVPVAAAPAPTAAAAESASDQDLWAPLVARPATPTPGAARSQASRNSVEVRLHPAAATQAARTPGDESRAAAPAASQAPGVAARVGAANGAPATEPGPAEVDGRAEPRHGLVWSPAKQQLVPAEPASVGLSATSAQPRSDDQAGASTATDRGTDRGSDKDVLPLDEEAHTTF